MKIQKKKSFFWGGGVRWGWGGGWSGGGVGVGLGGQSGCERRIGSFCENSKKKIFWGGVGGSVGEVVGG